jgi:hypothetical protein
MTVKRVRTCPICGRRHISYHTAKCCLRKLETRIMDSSPEISMILKKQYYSYRKEMRKYINHKRRIINKKDNMLSVDEISIKYGFHPNTVRRWVSVYGIRHIVTGRGGKIYINKVVVGDYIKQWYYEEKKKKF